MRTDWLFRLPPKQVPDDAAADVRVLPVRAALIASAAFIGLQLLFVAWVFPQGLLRPIRHLTAGLVQPTLIANVAILAVVIGAVLAGPGGQRRFDLGWTGSLAVALAGTAMVWLIVNIIEVGAAGTLVVDPDWLTMPGRPIGRWIAETFGTALLEETLFRGVALRPLALRLERHGWSPGRRWAFAISLSQVLLALIHIPLLAMTGAPVLDPLPGLFLAGTALALLYMATGNLFLCVGVHGLTDAPTLLMPDRLDLLDS